MGYKKLKVNGFWLFCQWSKKALSLKPELQFKEVVARMELIWENDLSDSRKESWKQLAKKLRLTQLHHNLEDSHKKLKTTNIPFLKIRYLHSYQIILSDIYDWVENNRQ